MTMRSHRLMEHNCTSILAFFDCAACESLEASYAESLNWHMRKAEREIEGQKQHSKPKKRLTPTKSGDLFG